MKPLSDQHGMWVQTSGPHRLAQVAVLGLLSGMFTPLSAQAIPHREQSLGQVVLQGEMSGRDRPRVERIELDTDAAGWEFVLQIANPSQVDLDLYVRREGIVPGEISRAATLLCRSEGIGDIETCRVLPSPRGVITVEVVAAGGGGKTRFTVRRRPLRGPRMGDTPLVAEDAQPLPVGLWTPVQIGGGSLPAAVLYAVALGTEPSSWIAAVSAADPPTEVTLAVLDEAGRPVATTTGATGYQDLPVTGDGVRYLLVTPRTPLRGRLQFEIAFLPSEGALPISLANGEFIASGQRSRLFALSLEEGRTAVIVVEGTASHLAVESKEAVVDVQRLFGGTQQLAWIGDPLANSTHVLAGVRTPQTIRIDVAAAAPDSLRYDRRAGWTMRVHVGEAQPNYLVRFGQEDVLAWTDWQSPSAEQRGVLRGEVPTGGIRMLLLRAQPPPAPIYQMRPPSQITDSGPVMYARLSEPSAAVFDLAVCTSDGRVLDIGNSTVRWRWRQDMGDIYVAVYPDPWNPAQKGGPFEIQVARSLVEAGR